MNSRLLWILIWREKKSRGFRVLTLALFLSVFSVVLINHFSVGTKRLLNQEAVELLGADLIIESTVPFFDKIAKQVKRYGLRQTEWIEFFSMVQVGQSVNHGMKLATIIALRGDFPLRGSAHITPQPGESWGGEDALLRLGIKRGAKIQIGKKSFTFLNNVIHPPITLSGVDLLAPHLYISAQALEGMGVLTIGSRATYRLLLTGEPEALVQFEKAVRSEWGDGLKWITPIRGGHAATRVVVMANRYLSIALFIQIVLAGIALLFATQQRCIELRQEQRIWKQVGATSSRYWQYHGMVYALWGGVIVVLAAGIAYFVVHTINDYLKQWFGYSLSFGYEGFWIGAGLDFAMVAKLGLQWLVLMMLVFCVFWGGWKAIAQSGNTRYLTWRLASSYFLRFRDQAIWQSMIFTMVISGLVLIYIFQTDFFKSWKAQLPSDTPNYFLINVLPENVAKIQQWYSQQDGNFITFYPIVRGRLTAINGKSQPSDRAFYRALNLTWMRYLPDSNERVVGKNWEAIASTHHQISVEEGFAKRQNIALGDQLTLTMDDESVTVEVAQLRKVVWESFKPNFFIIFPPGVIEKWSYSYMISMYLDPMHKSSLIALMKEYPDISLFDIEEIIGKIRVFTDKLVAILSLLLAMVGALGGVILYASVLATLEERLRENALLRILGARVSTIKKIVYVEFLTIGIVSGVLGGIIATVMAHYLAGTFFSVPFTWKIKWVALGVLLGAGGVTIMGRIAAHPIVVVSPLRLFRQT